MPFLLAIPLAVVGGAIGVFCTVFAVGLGYDDAWHAARLAARAVILPAALLPGFVQALPGTLILLPLAYYLTRHKVSVTPAVYALLGGGPAVLIIAPATLPLAWRAGELPRIVAANPEVARVLIGKGAGTLLAGIVCGALFGHLMRAHYRRYRLGLNESHEQHP